MSSRGTRVLTAVASEIKRDANEITRASQSRSFSWTTPSWARGSVDIATGSTVCRGLGSFSTITGRKSSRYHLSTHQQISRLAGGSINSLSVALSGGANRRAPQLQQEAAKR